jgi:hypothetical protein
LLGVGADYAASYGTQDEHDNLSDYYWSGDYSVTRSLIAGTAGAATGGVSSSAGFLTAIAAGTAINTTAQVGIDIYEGNEVRATDVAVRTAVNAAATAVGVGASQLLGKLASVSGRFSGSLIKVNKPDAAADALAARIGGVSRVQFSGDPLKKEFDAVSKHFIAETKPGTMTFGSAWRNQAKAVFQAARDNRKIAYFHFEGAPSKEFLDKLAEYSKRYGVKYIVDTKPLPK